MPGINMSKVHAITLTRGSDGFFEYQTFDFHPIDAQLLGNEGATHNDCFTYAIDARFVYRPCTGQSIEFEGDDDAWIFIDNRLMMDLGGIRAGASQIVDLDRLGLAAGGQHRLAFYYAQRQSGSAGFHLRTNIALTTGSLTPTVTDQYD